MSWKPWEEYGHLKVERLPIAAPPCPACRFWKPIPVFFPDGTFDGVRLCHVEEQYKDFSCFDEIAPPPEVKP